jgi:ribonucleoside-triphosphate reductase
LTEKKFHKGGEAYFIAKEIVKHMRNFTDTRHKSTRYNYSLLATSGEYISGRFVDLDVQHGFKHKINDKGFYTNSFHTEVDSGLTAFDKISIEAPFHSFCNGGCITYVEFKEAPVNNEQALEELICHATEQGVHYLGFNFDLDICDECGAKGIFDKCPKCNSVKIIRVRRVSGYLEILDYFTKGKKKEVKKRRRNT